MREQPRDRRGVGRVGMQSRPHKPTRAASPAKCVPPGPLCEASLNALHRYAAFRCRRHATHVHVLGHICTHAPRCAHLVVACTHVHDRPFAAIRTGSPAYEAQRSRLMRNAAEVSGSVFTRAPAALIEPSHLALYEGERKSGWETRSMSKQFVGRR